MPKYYLDTNICSYFMSGRYPKVSQNFRKHQPSDLAIPTIVAAELAAGVENSPEATKERNRADLTRLLDGIPTVPWGAHAMWLYGQHKTRLWRAGTKVEEIDLLLGCQALADEAIFVTNNTKHFEGIEELKLENWLSPTTE